MVNILLFDSSTQFVSWLPLEHYPKMAAVAPVDGDVNVVDVIVIRTDWLSIVQIQVQSSQGKKLCSSVNSNGSFMLTW